jgi:hypothetical protein
MTDLNIKPKVSRGRPKGQTDKTPRGGHKLTPDEVRDIRRIYNEQADDKKSFMDIQFKYNWVTKQTIEQIVKRKIWKSVV